MLFFVPMNNLPYTHLQFLDTVQSDYVYLSSDLYQLMSNVNGHLSLYAWLYNNYKLYYQAGTVPTYRNIVTKWLSTLPDEDRRGLEKIIQDEYEHYSSIMNNKSIENKGEFNVFQHSFSSLLFHIIDWWNKDNVSRTSRSIQSFTNNNIISWVVRLPPDNAVL